MATDLRVRVARGTLINAAFLLLVNGLGLVRGFVVAAFLTAGDYGLWGVLVVLLSTLLWLKQAGANEKYIQQQETDQALAFQRAMTVELTLVAVCGLLGLVLVPVATVVLGHPELLVPGLLLLLALPAIALPAPIWVYSRSLDFMQQRRLQAIDPVVGFVLTVGLAVAGAGYWSLLVGTLAGAWATAAAALIVSPYRLALRLDRATLRDYGAFSWPILIAGGSTIVFAQALTVVGNAAGGLALLGGISLASTVGQFANRADQAVSEALYPAICRVQDRLELLRETFVTSNRLALLWGVPFGVGACLFVGDLVEFVLGSGKWGHAVPLLQVVALMAAFDQIGFNLSSFYRACGDSRPTAVLAAVNLAVILVVGLPLLATHELRGLAIGIAAAEVAVLAARWRYLVRLFPGFPLWRFVARALAPAVPPAALVLLIRVLEVGPRTGGMAVAELVVYCAATAGIVLLVEPRLLDEAIGYLRGRGPALA